MGDSYEARQTLYEQVLKRKHDETLKGFVWYKGDPAAPHVLLGEDHTVQSGIALMLAMYDLVREGGKTLVFCEARKGTQNFTVRSRKDWHPNEKRLRSMGWLLTSIDLLLERGAHVEVWERQGLLRYKGEQPPLAMHQKRELAYATRYRDHTQSYDRVIGIGGSFHLFSRVYDRVLADTPHSRYVYKPFITPQASSE